MWWLEFGFNLWERSENGEFWKNKYEKLSEFDKDFYHRTLPLTMAMVRINHVSKVKILIRGGEGQKYFDYA